LEVTPKDIEAMLAAGAADVEKVHGPDGAAKIREETTKFFPMYERMSNRVLGNVVQFLKVY
jgi:hypothetical protein